MDLNLLWPVTTAISLYPMSLYHVPLYPCWTPVTTLNLSFFQFSSAAQSCPTLCDPMDCSTGARPPCPSPTSRVYPNSCPLSRWCHPAISSSVIPFSSLPSIFPSIRVFSNDTALRIRWPKYWSFRFSISPSNEYSGLISFRVDHLRPNERNQKRS